MSPGPLAPVPKNTTARTLSARPLHHYPAAAVSSATIASEVYSTSTHEPPDRVDAGPFTAHLPDPYEERAKQARLHPVHGRVVGVYRGGSQVIAIGRRDIGLAAQAASWFWRTGRPTWARPPPTQAQPCSTPA